MGMSKELYVTNFIVRWLVQWICLAAMWMNHQEQKMQQQTENEASTNTSVGTETSTEGNEHLQQQATPMVDDDVYQHLQNFVQPDKEFPDKERFAKFRKDREVFMLSCIIFMRKVVGEMYWKKHCHAKRVSEFCHPSDEAFLVLLIENNQRWWNHLALEK